MSFERRGAGQRCGVPAACPRGRERSQGPKPGNKMGENGARTGYVRDDIAFGSTHTFLETEEVKIMPA